MRGAFWAPNATHRCKVYSITLSEESADDALTLGCEGPGYEFALGARVDLRRGGPSSSGKVSFAASGRATWFGADHVRGVEGGGPMRVYRTTGSVEVEVTSRRGTVEPVPAAAREQASEGRSFPVVTPDFEVVGTATFIFDGIEQDGGLGTGPSSSTSAKPIIRVPFRVAANSFLARTFCHEPY